MLENRSQNKCGEECESRDKSHEPQKKDDKKGRVRPEGPGRLGMAFLSCQGAGNGNEGQKGQEPPDQHLESDENGIVGSCGVEPPHGRSVVRVS